MKEYLVSLNDETELLVWAKTQVISAESRDLPAEVDVNVKACWRQVDSEDVEYVPTDKELEFITDVIADKVLNEC